MMNDMQTQLDELDSTSSELDGLHSIKFNEEATEESIDNMVNMLWELVYNENEQDNTSERIHKQLGNFSDYLESLANQVQEYEKQNQEEYTWKNDTIKFAVNDYKLGRYPNRTEKLNRNTSSTRLNIKNKINKILKAITKKS